MFPPIPQIPSTAVAPIPTNKTALQLTVAELAVVKEYTALYSETEDKEERFDLLKRKILPRLYLLNKDLTPGDWKDRKKVST
jgi:uncharacterized protein Yka (UPF0111/DUF47 family)